MGLFRYQSHYIYIILTLSIRYFQDTSNETEGSRRSWIARKPLYSTEYLDALEGSEMHCSICPDYVTTNAQQVAYCA